MKQIIFGLLGFFSLQFSFAQSPDYSGTWKLSKEKSSFGEVPLFVVAQAITVEQKGDSIFLAGQNISAEGESSTSTARYSLKGTPTERLWNGDTKLVSSFSWSPEKSALVKNQIYTSPAQPDAPLRKLKEVWTLSEGGKLLTIEQTVEITGAEGYAVRAVYLKN